MIYSKKVYLIIIVFLFIICPNLFSQAKSGNTKDSVKTPLPYDILKYPADQTDSIFFNTKAELIKQIDKLNFTSPVIYFSEAGFPKTISVQFNGKGVGSGLKEFFDRCIAGSKITFGNCIIKNDTGSASKTLHKSIVLK